ncbi:MAG: DUF192 domain-containing protein [Bdellovibrio sp.]|nr:DUF192 domain-containing protein [Bdellovibrio sp.]
MPKLYKTSSDGAELLIEKLEVAESFWQRGRGLLGRKNLEANQALWIMPCNNIHTFFMKFTIDCIFVDKKMQIKKIVSRVSPFRFVGPYWKAFSVIETSEGFAEKKKLSIGDHLYVVS